MKKLQIRHPTVKRFLVGAAVGAGLGLFSRRLEGVIAAGVLGGLGWLAISSIGEQVAEVMQAAEPKE